MDANVMEKVSTELELADLSKQNLGLTLDQLHDSASSVLLLTLQWNEIEEHFDSTRNFIEARTKELQALEESVKGRIDELGKKEERLCAVEAREKELDSIRQSFKEKLNELERKEKEFDLKQRAEIERRREEVEWMEKSSKQLESVEQSVDKNLKELESKEKEFVLVEKSTEDSLKELKAIEESIEKQKQELDLNLEQFKGCAKDFELTRKWFGEGSRNFELKKKDLESKYEEKNKELELKEKKFDERVKELEYKEKELEQKSKELELKAQNLITSQENPKMKAEPLVNLLAKNVHSGVPVNGKCLLIYLNEHWNNGDDNDSMKNEVALAFQLLSSDPAKLVLDALQGFYPPHLEKGGGEFDGTVAQRSCFLLLEQLLKIKPQIEPEVKKEAIQLAIDWFNKVAVKPNYSMEVLGCLLLVAVYGLVSTFDANVLFELLEHVVLYDQAPALFRLLGFRNRIFGVIKNLLGREEIFAAIRFICEFQLFRSFPVGTLLYRHINCSKKLAREIAGPGNAPNVKKEFWEKRKADVITAIKYIEEKKLESLFPIQDIKTMLARLEKELACGKEMASTQAREGKPVDTRNEKCHGSSSGTAVIPPEQRSGIKRQRTIEPTGATRCVPVSGPCTSVQHPHPNPTGSGFVPSLVKTEGSTENWHLVAQTEPNAFSGGINGDLMRLLVEEPNNSCVEDSELSYALGNASDPAKLVLNTVMVLYPSNLEGGWEFKLRVSTNSCFFLLEQLKKLLPQIELPVKDEATKLATAWMSNLLKNPFDHLEVICFLQFLGIYKLVFLYKAEELLGLLDNGHWRTISPDLCQFLGLADEIPNFIQNLIKTGQPLKAIKYIYAFDVVEKFPTVPILNGFLRFSKESAENSCKNEILSVAARAAAINRHIKALQDAIKCIREHKLESEIPPATLNERLSLLLKQRSEERVHKPENIKTSTSEPTSNLSKHQTDKKKPTNSVSIGQNPFEASTKIHRLNPPSSVASAPNTSKATATIPPTSTSRNSIPETERWKQRRGRKSPWGNKPQRHYSLSGNSVVDSWASNYDNCSPESRYSLNPSWRPGEYNRGISGTPHTDSGYIRRQMPYYTGHSLGNHQYDPSYYTGCSLDNHQYNPYFRNNY